MSLFIIKLSLLTVVGALTFGDTTEPTDASSFDDARLRALFHVDPIAATLTVYMKFRAYGYFCLLYSNRMSHGDYNNIELSPGAVRILDQYSPGGHKAPINDTVNDLTPIGYQTDQLTYVVVKYSRPLKTNNIAGEDTVLTFGQSAVWSYAWKTGSSVMQFHEDQYETFSITLDNSSVNTMHTGQLSWPQLIHSVSLSILWIFFVDAAVIVKYQYSLKHRLTVHSILMATVLGGTILSIAALDLDGQASIGASSSSVKVHSTLGRIVFILAILQCSIGVLQRILLYVVINPLAVFSCRKGHLCLGILIISLGKANVVFGWIMKSQPVGQAFFFPAMGIGIAIILLTAYKSRPRISEACYQGTCCGIPKNNSLLALLEKPYNWPEVRNLNIVLFNDVAYNIPTANFHPGGRAIIEEVLGREVDRFLYGCVVLQRFPKLAPFNHPLSSQKLLTPLIQLPPNPVCTLPSPSFVMSSYVRLAEDVHILYFLPTDQSSIKYIPPSNLRHMGQYFVVSGFGYKRLYTCLLSQRSQKRKLRQQLLSRIIFDEHRLHRGSCPSAILYFSSNDENGRNPKTNQIALRDLQGQALPLIVKRYLQPSGKFTSQLYESPQTPLSIEGPKGRGLCLDALPAGNIVVIAAGTGLLPFVDLIDALFKLTMCNSPHSQTAKLWDSIQEYDFVRNGLKNKAFHMIISVRTFAELILPDEINLINSAASPLAKIYVRVSNGVPEHAFSGFSLPRDEKFGRELLQAKIGPLIGSLRMVYLCGPQQMMTDTLEYLESIGIRRDKIYCV